MANTHTHGVPRNTQGGWSLGQGPDAILTHVGVALPLIRLRGNEYHYRGDGSLTHTHTHTHDRTFTQHTDHRHAH